MDDLFFLARKGRVAKGAAFMGTLVGVKPIGDFDREGKTKVFAKAVGLKKAIEVCNRNRTQRNLIKLSKILRDGWVWVPCTAVLSDADQEAFNRKILEAADNDGLDALVGTELVSHDSIRFVPDILQSGEDSFFPVFTSEEEMGEYGEDFSRVQKHFLEAANLAKNNERNVKGIVINPFTEVFVVPAEMFGVVARMESSIGDSAGAEVQ
jgi:hypothetical protein